MYYGKTAQSWERIEEFYDGLAAENTAFRELATLARRLATSEFRAAGLHALTSMHDLLLGLSTDVLDNPFLRVAYDPHEEHFVLTYEPGGARMASIDHRWSRTAAPGQAYEVIERFLTRRARWFRRRMAAGSQRAEGGGA